MEQNRLFITLNMNQRSKSIIRKLKTDLEEDSTFDKKIARAMRDKKEMISKMTTPRVTTSNRCYNTNSTKVQKKPQQNEDKEKTIFISNTFIENIQKNGGFANLSCVNHPKKKGMFEKIQNRDFVYCHDCAINLAKGNVKVVQISCESLILKMFLQEQIQKIYQQERRVKVAVQEYYQTLREQFESFYKEFYQNFSKNQAITFGNFEQLQTLTKLTENLGSINKCLIKFGENIQKQNSGHTNNSLRNIENGGKKDRSIDFKTETNRSLQCINSKNGSFIGRSRDNSFYKKPSKPEIPRNLPLTSKYEGKKGYYMR